MNRRNLLSLLAGLPFVGAWAAKAQGLRISPLPHDGTVGDGVALRSMAHPNWPEPIHLVIERCWRDNITLTASACYDPTDSLEGGKFPELTSVAKMLLELAARNGELHEHPEVIDEIRSIVGRWSIP